MHHVIFYSEVCLCNVQKDQRHRRQLPASVMGKVHCCHLPPALVHCSLVLEDQICQSSSWGNKHRLPAKKWSALSAAGSFSCPAKHVGSRSVEICVLALLVVAMRVTFTIQQLYLIKTLLFCLQFLNPDGDVVVIIGTDRQQIPSSRLRASGPI